MSLLTQWRDDIRCVFERDPAARTTFEVLTTYPGVHAIIGYRLANRLWRAGWRYPARLLSFVARMLSNVDIHPGATIGERFFIDHGACVVIGETAEIGNDVTLYHGVTLGGTSWNKGKRHPTLRDGVLVGAGAKILGPITVGAGARVGANSVVVQDVPDGCTVVGIPGKVVKVREAGRPNPYGIDLDHHLIPDPVGKAIACLLERIDALEKQVEAGGLVTVGSQQQFYQVCNSDNSICESDCAGGTTAQAQQSAGRRRAVPTPVAE
ncbi:nitrogen fixation serine O-acetyltransferase CysE1 [Azotobacter vinelandii CA]|uniref:serine O-acetyltransferase n=2 Tax=Azotobacter vinelandii TaxID=354 RepID=C1DH21_AZOVD|nr:serine O-acetyltransferase [Azotobacter vinelandii]ACO76428.1 nitrogen fixation serine O-acetyltransferase CysE1 [Azotobacter vinelandii DJ]AGK13370.1 nitrogen fixation serine O-acetyltransferase CysE1 [Azotobacter vinelandii CA]AGK17724.1 nitrogen fixation serine O-acetyltransferase CysE1 [Azotobacter vinelandii CA6]WKN22207.1 serine O-acetyltransferase [Azotobacter vinelandii]SFX77256.1 serine O-acetyltransferase [Azotobacter vinelandii]